MTPESQRLRIAILQEPFAQRPIRLDHAPALAEQLLGRGHTLRGFGNTPGGLPHSGTAEHDPSADRGRLLPLSRFAPDVIVAYDALSTAGVMGARAARRLGCALVLVEVGVDPRAPLQRRLLARAGEWLWGSMVRREARTIVVLDPVARAHALEDGFDPARIAEIPLGVDLARYRPGLDSQLVTRHRIRGRMLLYAGRLEPSRGVHVLIEAFARTVGQRSDWSLVLAGEGSEHGRLRALSERLGVSDRVHWIGRTRREELPGLMGASTLLAVPALDNTVFGRQIGRAMACGLPVLASYLPRLTARVQPGATGLLAAPGDVTSWAAALQRAASAPVVRARWGQMAREVAERDLAWDHVGDAFEQVLQNSVAAARSASAPGAAPLMGISVSEAAPGTGSGPGAV